MKACLGQTCEDMIFRSTESLKAPSRFVFFGNEAYFLLIIQCTEPTQRYWNRCISDFIQNVFDVEEYFTWLYVDVTTHKLSLLRNICMRKSEMSVQLSP